MRIAAMLALVPTIAHATCVTAAMLVFAGSTSMSETSFLSGNAPKIVDARIAVAPGDGGGDVQANRADPGAQPHAQPRAQPRVEIGEGRAGVADLARIGEGDNAEPLADPLAVFDRAFEKRQAP